MEGSSTYRWKPEVSAAGIELSLDLVEQLRRYVEGQPGELLSGLLLGNRSDRKTIRVDDFEARASPRSEKARVVGCFRSHPHGFIPADEENPSGINRSLIEAMGVPLILLIQLERDSVPKASLFLQEKNADVTHTSDPFPFDRELLARGGPAELAAATEDTAREIPVDLPAVNVRRNRKWQAAAAAVGALCAVLIFAVLYWGKHSLEKTGVPGRAAMANRSKAASVAEGHNQDVIVPGRSGARTQSLRPPAAAEISFQPIPVSPSRSRRTAPRAESGFVPAKPVKQTPPAPTEEMSRNLTQPVFVDLRIRIAKSGRVRRGELVPRGRETAFDTLARNAASRWQFQPARMNNRPVESEMLVHFLFRPSNP